MPRVFRRDRPGKLHVSRYWRRGNRPPSTSNVQLQHRAIRFINNYSLCTRENYSLYPPSTSTHLCSCNILPYLLPRFIAYVPAVTHLVFNQHNVCACMWNFLDALCAVACREIIIYNNAHEILKEREEVFCANWELRNVSVTLPSKKNTRLMLQNKIEMEDSETRTIHSMKKSKVKKGSCAINYAETCLEQNI